MKATYVRTLWLVLLVAAASAVADDGVSGWGAVVGTPELDQWIAAAFSNSPALAARRDRMNVAQARTARARAAGRPDLSVEADWRWGRNKEPATKAESMTIEPFAGRARLEWELDLFGRIRAAVGAARYAEEVAGRELEARELTLAAELAQRYVQGRYLAEQLKLIRRATEANRAIEGYEANRAAAGLVRPEEVDRARAATRRAEARVEFTRERWEVLAARWRYLAATDDVPPLDQHAGELGKPAAPPQEGELHAYAIRRPDVRSAYAAWWEARRTASATARDREPSVTAIASAEGQGPSPVEDPEGWTAWAGVRLSLPVLAPERAAATRVARSQTRVSESLYNDAISRAVLDLQESYARRVRAERSWQTAREAAELLKTQLTSAEQRLEKGLAALPDVERARLLWLSAEEQSLALRARTLQEHLSLLRACGGPPEHRGP